MINKNQQIFTYTDEETKQKKMYIYYKNQE